jgi:hypothetical protein
VALRVQEKASPWVGLLLVASLIAVVVFGTLFASQRDWTAGVFALIAAAGAARFAVLGVRLARARAKEPGARIPDARAVNLPPSDARPGPPPAPAALTAPPPASSRAFVTTATHAIGLRLREGYVVIGRDAAAFVPTTGYKHIAAQIALGLVATRLSLSRTELDADDSPELAGELAALAGARGGFLLDERWSWARRGLALTRPDGGDYLTIDHDPPSAYIDRWASLPAAPAAELRRRIARVVRVAVAAAVLLAAAGIVTWRLTANADFLTAGLSFAGMIIIPTVIGVVLAGKHLRKRA